MYTHKVAVHNIANLTDARYFAARMVDWMFLTMPLSLDNANNFVKDITEWIEGPFLGIEDSDASIPPKELKQRSMLKGFLGPILHGSSFGYKMIKITAGVDLKFLEQNLTELNALVLLNRNLTLSQIRPVARFAYQKAIPLWLHIPDNLETISEIVSNIQIEGWFFSGSPEEAIGIKAYDQLDEAFDLISI